MPCPVSQPLPGSWEWEEFIGSQIIEKDGQRTYRAVTERGATAEAGFVATKSLGAKTYNVRGDIEAITGRSDIQMIQQLKDPYGAAFQVLMNKDPEALRELMGPVQEPVYGPYPGGGAGGQRPVIGTKFTPRQLPETWQGAAPEFVEAF